MRRLLILSTALLSLALTSCGRPRGVTNTNSNTLPANQVEKTSAARSEPPQPCINLNTATPEELTRLPGVGEITAQRIVDYRERHGRFRRPQDVIIIEGFSEKKYLAIAGLICVD